VAALAIRGGVGSPMPVGVTVRPDPAPVYPQPVSPMPHPGDPASGKPQVSPVGRPTLFERPATAPHEVELRRSPNGPVMTFITEEGRFPQMPERHLLEDAAVRAGYLYKADIDIPDTVLINTLEAELALHYETRRDPHPSPWLARWTLGPRNSSAR
jgi:hypothetical protein